MLIVHAAPPASAEQAVSRSIALEYTLTMFAIPFGHLTYSGRFAAGHYAAEMHFQTSGIAAVLWKSRIDNAVQGRATPAGLLPDVYTTESLNRGGTRRSVRVEYGGRAVPIMTAEPPYDISRDPVSDAQKKGAVDPLTGISALVAGLSTSAAQPCGRTIAVFDGRRRYDVVFAFVRNEPHADGTEARVCEAEYRHVAGIPQDVVAVAKVPAIYAAFIDVSGGNAHFTIAQTMWSSFLWGAVEAKLTGVSIQGHTVAVDR